MTNAERRTRIIQDSIKDAVKTEHLIVTGVLGTKIVISASESLRTIKHFDARYVMDDAKAAWRDPENATNPEGDLYAEIVEGWEVFTKKEKDQWITDDYGSLVDEIEKEFDAAIADAEAVESVCGAECEE